MDAIITVMAILLIIAGLLAVRIADLRAEKARCERRLRLMKLIHARAESRAQAEIRALEDKLREVTK